MTPTEQDKELREKLNSHFEAVFSQGVRAGKDVSTKTYEDFNAWRKGGEIDEIMQLITAYTNKQIEAVLDRLGERIDYNKHDMGELGEFIRTKYSHNFIDDERNKLNRRKYEQG